ncbi:MAG: 2-hydroxymuconic semialdehyde dehydrogenase [Deltaproteobacteria bacterium]|nr:2-hydroxymuconic semialdehyde dehydrogenase [Deltaproteobacteria bacterium]
MSAELDLWIQGAPRPARGSERFANTNPATGELISEVARARAEDVADAVSAAKAALPAWRSTSVAERADILDAIADGIEADLDGFAEAESRDTGKPISLARSIDIPRAIANFRFFAGAVRHDETGFHRMDHAINYTLRKPLGVVGLITPWNLPLYLLTWKTAPALAMGNTLVAKPSELTPSTASRMAEVMKGAGLPDGVFNIVHGFGAECGEALVSHDDVSAISFTGGTQTGARVAATAAPRFKKLSLELGGKNSTLVFADVDLDEAVQGAVRAGFTNQGQVCLCGSRVLIERPIYEAFRERFIAGVRAMEVGDPRDPATRIGSLVSADHRSKVESYIALAREEGGHILTGGARPALPAPLDRGAFLEPTVVDGLAPDCRTSTEEIFGPVVTLHPFDTEEEAIAIANGTQYGLAASVWTRDLERAHRVSAQLDTGMVWVNTWLMRDLRVPFGGVKASGVGREGGKYSLGFFSESVNICVKLGGDR